MTSRTEIINNMIRLYGLKSYLEIGVDHPDMNFNKINCEKKIGVDPNPKARATFLGTSDQFFAQNKETFDCVFIDGDHSCPQVYMDIHHSLEVLNKGGIIVAHDCNPTTEAMQKVPRIQGVYTGDVWRAFCSFRTNPYLYTTVLDTDYGVGIIRDGRQEFVSIPENKTYQDFTIHKKEWLNLVSSELEPVSIVIPAFEQYGHGAKTLTALLQSIVGMKGKFEVLVSDNSPEYGLIHVCTPFMDKLPIQYIHNPNRGISQNTNFAIDQAQYNLIKPMYQDDVFLSTSAVEDISFALKVHTWVACSGLAIDERGNERRKHTPKWENDLLLTGKNRLGMPSVVAFRKNGLRFDTNLKTMLDCAFYYELYQHYGDPGIIKVPLIGSRYWDGSTSRKQGSYIKQELPYLKQKYSL